LTKEGEKRNGRISNVYQDDEKQKKRTKNNNNL
jgi:hypothetical protein